MKPINFDGVDANYVGSYNGIDHEIWNHTKGPIVALRHSIRAHYLIEQKFRCAYCRMGKKESHGLSWDVEHIIPKSTHPKYLFEPENLALACKECNLSKLNKGVLVKNIADNAEYPRVPGAFTIIHPHYDTYSDHIEIAVLAQKVSHRPKNRGKGKETFIICDLVRFSYAFAEWEDFNYAIVKEFSDYIKRCPGDATKDDIVRFMSTLNFTVETDF
ncbi:HNH endonuclease [Janthinobacterium sp. LB2P49]|uniref:HNH endonuclease n=1 Tax=Janthinobacterium sp. LB2P49 TaxID=3424198 RepID=UPI003F26676A